MNSRVAANKEFGEALLKTDCATFDFSADGVTNHKIIP